MPQCNGITSGAGRHQCTRHGHQNFAIQDLVFCRTHYNLELAAGPRVAGECCFIKPNRHRCGNVIGVGREGHVTCHRHRTVQIQLDQAFNIPLQLEPAPPPPMNQELGNAAQARERRRNGELGKLAGDAQNVHTGIVVKHTNDGTEKLLSIPVPKDQKTLPEITAAVMMKLTIYKFNKVIDVLSDMGRWYACHTCREEGDYLYKRVLDGLWARIRSETNAETQKELIHRLYQEIHESNGMCCEGHISRLVNVMVGFDDAFAPPVSFGELLQNKMAAIYAMDIDTAEKVKQATAYFDELGVPAAERTAWIEAF